MDVVEVFEVRRTGGEERRPILRSLRETAGGSASPLHSTCT
jgi:hypothetical protein